ncbi:hypothetical protein [Limnohabitans sp. 63ED37-2]|uniref:hypothetical protein n=1 Tax=Limnohabitans sp. 63ED37-2 TaxID=1678128 RepID=UPI0012E2E8D0|nr:hypothetical protein [Limnohabitans sp. 63ED37-2]
MADIHINSFKSAKLDIFSQTNVYLSSATGYFIKHNERFYLVSNLHVVSGKNPQTGKNIRTDCAIPGFIEAYIQATTNKTESTIELIEKKISIPLYKKLPDDSQEYDIHSPLWLSENKKKFDIALMADSSTRCNKDKPGDGWLRMSRHHGHSNRQVQVARCTSTSAEKNDTKFTAS